MTVVRHITFWCDGEESPGVTCDELCETPETHLAYARRRALQAGWSNVKRKDYCPKHTTIARQVTP